MSIPNFEQIMSPMIKDIIDGENHSMNDIVDHLSEFFNLTEDEKNVRYPTSGAKIFQNRVRFARLYLMKAGLIESPIRGFIKLTSDGLMLFKKETPNINLDYLEKLPKFQEFQKMQKETQRNKKDSSNNERIVLHAENNLEQIPEEQLENAFQIINDNLSVEILDTLKKCQPLFFEKIVVDLVLKMGYGGSFKDAGEAIGKSGDGGIDGIIKEDRLGLDLIYLQAKRWENVVPVKEIRDFAGSLMSKKAKKGIFITTSSYPTSAFEFVKSVDHRIILIDGQQLAKLLIDFNVGVTTESVYEIKKIDGDYFIEE
ncbi:MAG: restriction endonuclease [Candidatus Buchananbacteria bacterium]